MKLMSGALQAQKISKVQSEISISFGTFFGGSLQILPPPETPSLQGSAPPAVLAQTRLSWT